ncbi:hypothetical protein LguiB_025141 [Lonicera macranthoides]
MRGCASWCLARGISVPSQAHRSRSFGGSGTTSHECRCIPTHSFCYGNLSTNFFLGEIPDVRILSIFGNNSDEYSLVWRNGNSSDEYSHTGSWGILRDPYNYLLIFYRFID